MKGYEAAARSELSRRMPVIIRVDGKAFHTYTSDLDRPFDHRLSDVMFDTTKQLCKQIQGAQLGYTQSDEISILIHSYKRFSSQPWFDNQIQKMVSVAAGVVSSYFTAESWRMWHHPDTTIHDSIVPAVFDARAFIVPEADVCNYFIWRQQDAMRNSVQMMARAMYSHKQCDSKNVDQLKQMILDKNDPRYPLGWDSLSLQYQRGRTWRHPFKPEECKLNPDSSATREWTEGIPLFTKNRDYINDLLKLEEE